MRKELRDRIREAGVLSAAEESEFVDLLRLIDAHYEKMEATITESLVQSVPSDAIFDGITDALLAVDADGIIRRCNKACLQHFALPEEQLLGASLEILLPAAGKQPIDEYLKPFMPELEQDSENSGPVTAEACRGDGRAFIAEVQCSKRPTATGPVFILSLRDVTGRAEGEQALKENEERYRALVENAPEAIVVFDVGANRIVDANDKACMLFNLSRARLLCIGPEEISPERQADGLPSFGVTRGYVDAALEGQHPTFEWLHLDSDGNEISCEVRFSRLPSTDRRLIRASITDISQRKQDEKLAFAENKILEMIAAGTPYKRTLRTICRSAERINPRFRAAVFEMDHGNRRLDMAEAPSLPQPFASCLASIDLRAEGLTCLEAATRGRVSICENIAEDLGWKVFAESASQHGIAAVWSLPLRCTDDRVIGTFDVYIDVPRSPGADELVNIRRLSRLAGIAIKRQRDENRLKNSELRYRGLFENVVDGVYIATRDGTLIAANPALVEMLGYANAEELKAVGSTAELYVNPIDRERVFARLEAQGYVKNFEYRLRRKDGQIIVVLENARAVHDDDNNIVAVEGTISDITERKLAETRVFEEKERAQVTLQSIGDGVVTTDAKGNVDYINPVAAELTGWDMRAVRRQPVSEVIQIVHEHTRASVDNPVLRCIKEGAVITLQEHAVLIDANGDETPVQGTAAPIRDRVGNVTGSVIVFHDITKETRLFRQLSYQATHDALTGLVNRREFENRLKPALEKLKGDPESTHALLHLDFDQFKVINDTFGHAAGDSLLCQLAELTHGKIRSTDLLARLSGDEFGILLEFCSKTRAMEVAESIRSAIEGYRFEWQGSFAGLRCSIGVVMLTSQDDDVNALMSSADVACYSAKDMGRNQVHLYQDSDAALRHEEMKWVSRISSAVEDSRLEIHFQPIVSTEEESQAAHGHYELLLRMRDEHGKLVSPNLFIPAAERYNLMSTLDRWVIREALSKLADRRDENKAYYTIAINLSGTSLSEDRFLADVIEEVRRHKLPEGAVCFEITETAAISNLSRVVGFMQTLKGLGCRFSLDDFGSGLSSFTYLKNLPVDYLKIDGQFIRNVAEDVVDESMVSAICQVGQAMGIETIAERVESREVLEKLAELGVNYAQGHYIARPASIRSFEPWALSRSAPLSA